MCCAVAVKKKNSLPLHAPRRFSEALRPRTACSSATTSYIPLLRSLAWCVRYTWYTRCLIFGLPHAMSWCMICKQCPTMKFISIQMTDSSVPATPSRFTHVIGVASSCMKQHRCRTSEGLLHSTKINPQNKISCLVQQARPFAAHCLSNSTAVLKLYNDVL